MKVRLLISIIAITVLAALAVPLQVGAQDKADWEQAKFITFDAPGAGTGHRRGTFGVSINPSGTIAGFYLDAKDTDHGFVRTRDGSFTTFDVPGAGTGAGAAGTDRSGRPVLLRSIPAIPPGGKAQGIRARQWRAFDWRPALLCFP